MEIAYGRLIEVDDLGRSHLALKPAQVDALYEYSRSFWSKRQEFNARQLTKAEIEKIISGQFVTDTPYNRGERRKLKELYETSDAFSMIELGAANGTVFDRLGADDFPYVGYEMMPELADDLKRKHPGATVKIGGAEQFIKQYPFARFDLFYAHVSLLMIKPELVRAVLHKAARCADQLLIYDHMDYPRHDLDADETLVFDTRRPDKWFIHDWDRYIPEAGFRIVDKEIVEASTDERYDRQLGGFGYIHAAMGATG